MTVPDVTDGPTAASQVLRVAIVDDDPFVLHALRAYLSSDERIEVASTFSRAADALAFLHKIRVDVLLTDVRMPEMDGLELLTRVRRQWPRTAVVVLTSFDDDEALAEALEVGARAYVLKSVHGAEISDVVRAVADGRVLLDERTVTRRRADHDDPTADLTNAERKVLVLIGEGLSNREIGAQLGVAEKTVKNHITSLLAKMGLQRRTQVAAWVASQRASGWRAGSRS